MAAVETGQRAKGHSDLVRRTSAQPAEAAVVESARPISSAPSATCSRRTRPSGTAGHPCCEP